MRLWAHGAWTSGTYCGDTRTAHPRLSAFLSFDVRSADFCLKSGYHGNHMEHRTRSSTALLPPGIESPMCRAQIPCDNHTACAPHTSSVLPPTRASGTTKYVQRITKWPVKRMNALRENLRRRPHRSLTPWSRVPLTGGRHSPPGLEAHVCISTVGPLTLSQGQVHLNDVWPGLARR